MTLLFFVIAVNVVSAETPAVSSAKPVESSTAPVQDAANATNKATEGVTADPKGAAGTPSEEVTKPPQKCKGWLDSLSPMCLTDAVIGAVGALINTVLLSMVGGALALAGALFDAAFNLSVLNFKDLMGVVGADGSTGASNNLYSVWMLLRNIFNVFIAFALIRIAIGLISSGAPKKCQHNACVTN